MSKKALVTLIKKIGQDLEAPPITNVSAPAAPAKPNVPAPVAKPAPLESFTENPINTNTPKPRGSGSVSSPAVREMQSAILNFADVAGSTDVTSLQGNQQGRQYGEQSREMPDQDGIPTSRLDDKKQFLGGSDPFGKFLVDQYVNDGKQYLNVDVSGNKNRENASMDNANLRGMIDTMRRVGKPGEEKSTDGVWQVRTNNALKNIFLLTKAMMGFVTDMKMTAKGYDQEQLTKFQSLIPKEYTELTSFGEFSNRAKEITPHIVAITGFFKSLKRAVFNNKNLRKYIDQKESFHKYDKEYDATKRPTDQSIILDGKLPFVKEQKSNWINLSELSSVDAFKAFIHRAIGHEQPASPEQMKNVLGLLTKALDDQEIANTPRGGVNK